MNWPYLPGHPVGLELGFDVPEQIAPVRRWSFWRLPEEDMTQKLTHTYIWTWTLSWNDVNGTALDYCGHFLIHVNAQSKLVRRNGAKSICDVGPMRSRTQRWNIWSNATGSDYFGIWT